MRLWNFRGEQNTITGALRLTLPDHAVICVTGAGGKTTLITSWARELASSGKRTVITTTTHMAHPDHPIAGSPDPYNGIPVIYDPLSTPGPDREPESESDPEPSPEFCARIKRSLDEHGLIMVVSPDPDNPAKVKAPSPWLMDHLYKTADIVLIEADGSRRMPFKWPAPWEPVVPENTDITVCVAGLSALGRPLAEVMYRYDSLPEPMRRETVDVNLICAVTSSLEGGQKDIYGEFRVFLNQADTRELQEEAAYMQRLFAVRGIQSAWGSLK